MTTQIKQKPVSVRTLPGAGELSTLIQQLPERLPEHRPVEVKFVAGANLQQVKTALLAFSKTVLQENGALLIRGLNFDTLEFQNFIDELSSGHRAFYGEIQSPRKHITGNVFTSTEHPSSQRIQLHNENAHRMEWPKLIAFYCVEPAAEGGATPIANNKTVASLLSAQTLEQFTRLGVRYWRNFNEGFGVPWQTVFSTQDKHEVERYCKINEISFIWRNTDQLKIWYDRPAFVLHPDNLQVIWCNNTAFYHPRSLEHRQYRTLRLLMTESEMPTYVTFGDGTPIPDPVIDEVRNAYTQATQRFEWEQGDLLILDNILYAHGRDAFSGTRKVLVTMAEPVFRQSHADLSRPAQLNT